MLLQGVALAEFLLSQGEFVRSSSPGLLSKPSQGHADRKSFAQPGIGEEPLKSIVRSGLGLLPPVPDTSPRCLGWSPLAHGCEQALRKCFPSAKAWLSYYLMCG